MANGDSPASDPPRNATRGGVNGPAADKPPAGSADKPRLPQVRPARIAKSSTTPPLTSRTATLDDPLTTSLLAEIARRPATVEMSPAELAAARAMAPDAPEPPADDDPDPDDPP